MAGFLLPFEKIINQRRDFPPLAYPRRMQRHIKAIFAVAFLLSTLSAHAQEVLLNDSATIPPFEGVIGFRIRYEGKLNPATKPYLADSMTMFIGTTAAKAGNCSRRSFGMVKRRPFGYSTKGAKQLT